jgi:outer membrane protein assembly factor BamA
MRAYFTDPLGTRQLASTVFGGSFGGGVDFKDAFGGETVYLNQRRRLQWGVIGSRLPYLSGVTFIESGTVDIDGTMVPADAITNIIDIVTASEVGAFTQFPFSLTRRIEASASVSHIGYERSLERLVLPEGEPGYWEDFDLPSPPALDLRRVGVAYVSDTSHYGFLSPLRGRRFRVEQEQTTGDLDFGTTLFDYRRYFFTRPVSFAFRALHVARRGTDAESAQLALLDVGRDSLVRGYDLGSFDLSECTLTPGATSCPEYDRLLGSRIAVLNFEVRIPVLGNRDLGLFRAPRFPLEAVAFVDVGAAWRSGQPVDWRFARDTTARVPVVSAGIAVRVLVGGFLPIEAFYAKPYQRPREDTVFGFRIATGW